MSQTMGTLDFFLLEGGEYLERLDALAQTPSGAFPQGDELLRLCRAFRGSAIMASQHGMARTGQGLESCARAIREQRLGWTEATRAELVRAVDDARILMRRLRNPEQGDTEKAEAIGIGLDRMSGRASAQMRAAVGPGLDAGGRAFVAREAASIASVLQHASRTLRGDPANRDVLVSISPSMSALRGVAILNDLPPLGEILSAIEHAAKDVLAAAGTLGTDVADVFEAGAKALARAAREVVDQGRPDSEAEESHAFASRLFAVLTGGHVVSIESLFFDDAGPHIVKQGDAPQQGGSGLARVEMVSHGEYLNAAAAELAKVTAPIQRDLRLYGIAASVRPMVGAGGSPLASSLGRLADAARDAIGRGAASHRTEEFIAAIRDAATALVAAQSGEESRIEERIAAAATTLSRLTRQMATRAMKAMPEQEQVRPQVQKSEPVPPQAQREQAQPQAAAPPAPPAPVPAPAAPAPASAPLMDESDLSVSFLTLEQLLNERGMPKGDLSELLSAPTESPLGRTTGPRDLGAKAPPRRESLGDLPPEPPIVPIESLAPDLPPGIVPDEEGAVPIECLMYSGEAALRRAVELRPQLVAAQGDPARLHALLNEVFDLVELGRSAAR